MRRVAKVFGNAQSNTIHFSGYGPQAKSAETSRASSDWAPDSDTGESDANRTCQFSLYLFYFLQNNIGYYCLVNFKPEVTYIRL